MPLGRRTTAASCATTRQRPQRGAGLCASLIALPQTSASKRRRLMRCEKTAPKPRVHLFTCKCLDLLFAPLFSLPPTRTHTHTRAHNVRAHIPGAVHRAFCLQASGWRLRGQNPVMRCEQRTQTKDTQSLCAMFRLTPLQRTWLRLWRSLVGWCTRSPSRTKPPMCKRHFSLSLDRSLHDASFLA